MGLFDDLLKTPAHTGDMSGATQGSSGSTQGSNPSGQDPLAQATGAIKIEKTEEIPLQTEPVFVKAPEPIDMTPPMIRSDAIAEDGNILLMGNSIPTTINESTTVTPTNEASIESPVIITESLESPIQEVQQVHQITPQEVLGNSINLLNLDTSRSQETISSPEVATQMNPMIEIQPEEVTTKSDSSGILELASTNTEDENIESVEAVQEIAMNLSTETVGASMGEMNLPSKEENISHDEVPVFSDPKSFISDSLAKIEIMLGVMNEKHNAKLDEAASYKSEKERFAALEAQAYELAESMTKEMEHAERMKAYFTKELKHTENKKSEVAESVETTLTTLAVKNTVEGVTEKSEVHKDPKAKMEV